MHKWLKRASGLDAQVAQTHKWLRHKQVSSAHMFASTELDHRWSRRPSGSGLCTCCTHSYVEIPDPPRLMTQTAYV
eukprot:1154799-Pelagomonas_calceolata.AAC.1